MATPRASRTRSNQETAEGGQADSPVLKSALRGSRTAPPPSIHKPDSLPSTTPRKVSFVGVPPTSSAESSLLEESPRQPESSMTADRAALSLKNGLQDESIIMLAQNDNSLLLTNPPWDESPAKLRSASQSASKPSHSKRGGNASADPEHSESIGSMDTQILPHPKHLHLDATAVAPSSPMMHLPLSPPPLAGGRPSLDGVAGIGVGMSGDVFRKLAGWSRGALSPRHPLDSQAKPSLQTNTVQKLVEGHATYSAKGDVAGAETNTQDNGSEGKGSISSDAKSPDKANSTVTSQDSSLSAASVSPVKTEPMRSQILSNFSTPQSARYSRDTSTRQSVAGAGRGATPPTRSTPSSKRSLQTPSRSVNPLARHLAMKAIRSAPPEQRSELMQSPMPQNSTPTHRKGKEDHVESLFDINQPISGISSSLDASGMMGSDVLDFTEIERQLDGFASRLKHDASAVQAEVRESEEAWFAMQQELQNLKTQLVDAEATRDFYKRQAEASEKDRDEWELERQQLVDEKDELAQNIQEWRKRIGDVESERQGVWAEGYQTREQLLHTIIKLEDDLGDARSEASRARAELAALNAEFAEKEAAWDDHHRELNGHLEAFEVEYDRLEADNRQLLADLADADTKRELAEREALKNADLVKEAQSKAVGLEFQLSKVQDGNAAASARASEAEKRASMLEGKLASTEHTFDSTKSREAELNAELASLRDANALLKETLEDLTEEMRDLKQSRSESNLFTTALSTSALPIPVQDRPGAQAAASDESEDIVTLKAQHREELERVKNDFGELVDSMNALMESKNKYKKENLELTEMAESARSQIESLQRQLSECQSEALALREDSKASKQQQSTDEDLDQLRESEERLTQELGIVERENEKLSERVNALDSRNKHLLQKNDELSQRTARLETELSDLQVQISSSHEGNRALDGDEADELQKKVSYLQQTAADLEQEVLRTQKENDQLRQTLANKDVQMDDLQTSLVRTQEQLASEKKALANAHGQMAELHTAEDKLKHELTDLKSAASRPLASQKGTVDINPSDSPSGASAVEAPNIDQPEQLVHREFKLSQSVRDIKSDISALEHSNRQLTERREKLHKEERFLANQLRDMLLRNATLRNEVTAILLRRAGKARELQALLRVNSTPSDYASPSDDGNSSFMSGTINNVPTASQLIDGSSSKFFKSLDKHLDEMVEIIDNGDDTQSQRSLPGKTASLKRSNSQPTGGRAATRMLTPIKEEISAHQYAQSDASVQCDLVSEEISDAQKQLEDDLDVARSQVYRLEEQCRALQSSIAEVKQERDQFKVSQEEAAERGSRLTGQIEELSENHERMKAINITTARISHRVNRQLHVLRKALGRLAPRDSLQTGQGSGSSQQSSQEADDKEDALALEEDDAMIKATMDHPLGIDDYAAFDAALQPVSGEARVEDGKGASNDDVLEQVGISVSEAYGEVKRIRRDITRAKKERSRLMKRLAEVERSKLPSYELSAQWGRKMRHRSYTESLVGSHTGLGGAKGSNDDSNISEHLLEDIEPPASLFLADESAVMAEIAASQKDSLGGKRAANGAAPGQSLVVEEGSMFSQSMLKDPVVCAAEITRLTVQLKKKDRRLKLVEKDRDKLEEFNRELVQKLDRSYSEKLRAQQECNAMMLRTNARSASRTATPSRGTDWDDIESIQQELERCKHKNKAYFANVETLCKVLNKHTIDQALLDVDAEDEAIASARGSGNGNGNGNGNGSKSSLQPENIYRALLIDMAASLDAKGDLDEKKSIRDNFSSMAAAVRKRLGGQEKELEKLQSELKVARLAHEAAANASTLSTKTSASMEGRLRKSERHAAELETQITEAQEQLTNHQANIRSLNDNISRLRQQCVAAESDLQEARLERDGWHQQFLACEQTLSYQMEENDKLSEEIKRLSSMRSRNTEELMMSGRISYGDNSAPINWEQVREEWATAAREEAAEVWRSKEFVLRQTYEAQIKIFCWAGSVWSDIVGTMLKQSARDITPMPGRGYGSKANDSIVKAKSDTLRRAMDELGAEVDRAIKRADAVQDSLQPTGSVKGTKGKTSRADFVESLNQIMQGLGRDFAGAWRESVRNCIVTVAASISYASHGSAVSRESTADNTATTATSSSSPSDSSSSGFPRLSGEQKAMIRDHYGKREAELKREFKARLQNEREVHKSQEAAIKETYKKEKKLIISEIKYLRGRIQIDADRGTLVQYQKEVLLQLIGGHEGMFHRINALVRQRQVRTSPMQADSEHVNRSRRLWRRALLAVRFKNRLAELLLEKKMVNSIKADALSGMSSVERKVIIAPKQFSANALQQLRLPNPRTGELCSYYADVQNEALLEAVKLDMDGKKSWLGSDWVLGDGSATLLTPIDPLFIFLSLVTQESMTKGDEWKFVDIDSLQLESHSSIDAASIGILLGMAKAKASAFDTLCEVKDVTSDMRVVKIDETKVLRWLRRKCDASRLPRCLEGSIKDISTTDAGLIREAKEHEMALLVSEYLLPFWADRLNAEFGGFAQVCRREKEISQIQTVSYDSPDSYTPGVASKSATTKPSQTGVSTCYVCISNAHAHDTVKHSNDIKLVPSHLLTRRE
ncbi:hypothetical protein GGI12_000112 [Dipsacomyces acuminosporus]|nr:hypothetical protein GGI12_000112 [Dipsacomyces acuminosporus]